MTHGNEESACALVKELERFVCEVSCLDRIWHVLFPDRAGTWRHLHVQQYKDSHYLTRVGDEARSLEVVRGKRVRVGSGECAGPTAGAGTRAGEGRSDQGGVRTRQSRPVNPSSRCPQRL